MARAHAAKPHHLVFISSKPKVNSEQPFRRVDVLFLAPRAIETRRVVQWPVSKGKLVVWWKRNKFMKDYLREREGVFTESSIRFCSIQQSLALPLFAPSAAH